MTRLKFDKNIYWELLSPLIAIIFVIIAIIKISNSNYIFGQGQTFGIVLLCFSILLFFIHLPSYRFVYLIFLLLGLVGIIGVTLSITTIGIIGVGIQPLFLLLFLLFSPSLGELKSIEKLENFFASKNKKEKYNKINFFYKKFQPIDNETLKRRLNENLDQDARKAIIKILSERV